MGSGRELDLRDGIDRPAEGAGTVDEGLAPGLAPGWPGRSRLRSKKMAALFRTWEKSWKARQELVSVRQLTQHSHLLDSNQLTVGLIPRSKVLRSPVLRSPL
jgi:hypothetical protein